MQNVDSHILFVFDVHFYEHEYTERTSDGAHRNNNETGAVKLLRISVLNLMTVDLLISDVI